MRLHITHWHDQEGHFRAFHASKEEAMKFIKEKGASEESPTYKGGELPSYFGTSNIPTDKKGLIRWLNTNCGNADGN